mmetsp:Transcript_5226/g.16437  ORF Transcript_5226/g.16437 Transcript_5226/m.16437 type:complete len:204 (+) Transcript_5226:374-985(+)
MPSTVARNRSPPGTSSSSASSRSAPPPTELCASCPWSTPCDSKTNCSASPSSPSTSFPCWTLHTTERTPTTTPSELSSARVASPSSSSPQVTCFLLLLRAPPRGASLLFRHRSLQLLLLAFGRATSKRHAPSSPRTRDGRRRRRRRRSPLYLLRILPLLQDATPPIVGRSLRWHSATTVAEEHKDSVLLTKSRRATRWPWGSG